MRVWARFFVALAFSALVAYQTQAAVVSGGGEATATTTTMLDLKKYTDRIPNGNRLFDMQAAGQTAKSPTTMTKSKSTGPSTMKTTTTTSSSSTDSSSSTATTTNGAFAKAFEVAGFQWTRALCEADSDGDGQTNGQELGDPCCSWTLTGNLAYISGASNPSDPTSKANPQMFENIVCTRTKTAKIQESNRLKSTKANATASAAKKSSGSIAPTAKANTKKSFNATQADKSQGTASSVANSTNPVGGDVALRGSAARGNAQTSSAIYATTMCAVVLALYHL